jgi:hypothetical protein
MSCSSERAFGSWETRWDRCFPDTYKREFKLLAGCIADMQSRISEFERGIRPRRLALAFHYPYVLLLCV